MCSQASTILPSRRWKTMVTWTLTLLPPCCPTVLGCCRSRCIRPARPLGSSRAAASGGADPLAERGRDPAPSCQTAREADEHGQGRIGRLHLRGGGGLGAAPRWLEPPRRGAD